MSDESRRDGIKQGINSAKEGRKKETVTQAVRFVADKDFRQGWKDGLNVGENRDKK